MSGWTKVATQYLPPTSSGRVLAGAAALDSIGSGIFLALLPVFLVSQLHVNPLDVGFVVGAASLVGMLGPIPAGMLSDRFGAGVLWTALLLLRAVGYSGFLLVHSLHSYAVLACVIALLDRANTPLQQAFVLQVEPPEQRSRSMAVLRTVRNAGLSVGLLLSGLLISIGGRDAFLAGFAINSGSYLILVVAVRRLDNRRAANPPVRVPAPVTTPPPARAAVWHDLRYLLLSAGNMLLTLHDSVLFTLIPLWVVSRSSVPAAAIGPLLAVNTVVTVVLQVPLTGWAVGIASARRTVTASLLPLLAACLLFACAEPANALVATGLAVLAVLALTLGENMHTVAAFELSHRMAPEAAMGSYLGMFNMGWSAQLAAGPPFMTALVLRGPFGWATLAGAFIIGSTTMRAGSRQAR